MSFTTIPDILSNICFFFDYHVVYNILAYINKSFSLLINKNVYIINKYKKEKIKENTLYYSYNLTISSKVAERFELVKSSWDIPNFNSYYAFNFIYLKYLSCYNKNITYLPNLDNLPNLLELSCSNCRLKSLPELPVKLKYLSCNMTLIKELPNLPKTLLTLDVSGNELVSLPELPNCLEYLNCNNNTLHCLPGLPLNLITLLCTNNLISNIKCFPSNLVNINLSNNKLIKLPSLKLCTKLTTLFCSKNQISSINNLNLPNSLTDISFEFNLIEESQKLPVNLKRLNLAYNRLTSIHYLPDSIEELWCENNPELEYITELPNSIKTINTLKTLLPHRMRIYFDDDIRIASRFRIKNNN